MHYGRSIDHSYSIDRSCISVASCIVYKYICKGNKIRLVIRNDSFQQLLEKTESTGSSVNVKY